MKWIGIDAWTVYKDYKDYCQTDLETEAEKAAIERVKNIKSVSLIKDWSVPASEKFEDGSLDFIFIDSNHTYEWVVEDLKAWAKKVKPGGIVMGHDYFVNRRFNFGVIEAVNGWVATHQINHLFKSKDQCPCWFYVQGDVSK